MRSNPEIILAHELFGHAAAESLNNGPDSMAIDIENLVRKDLSNDDDFWGQRDGQDH